MERGLEKGVWKSAPLVQHDNLKAFIDTLRSEKESLLQEQTKLKDALL